MTNRLSLGPGLVFFEGLATKTKPGFATGVSYFLEGFVLPCLYKRVQPGFRAHQHSPIGDCPV
ncbi:hypothetical protein [Polynucleobacter sp. MWH-UH35A]|uniref:hypothetical protein n=1 Tax=Polynucleobacter sp. MWH-UH35A TaxID=1855619 RepID=UPI002040A320|nr:hypothetical protein [Polynucleobacter sp. MWH-UH35A]